MKLRFAPRGLIGLFRRSLQFRAVAITVALSGVLLVLLGGFLSYSIGNGLFQTRLHQVLDESERAATDVQNTFSAATITDEVALQSLMNSVIPNLESNTDSQSRRVALIRTVSQPPTALTLQSPISADLDSNLISSNFREKVAGGNGRLAYQSIALPLGSVTHPGLIVGASIQIPLAGAYELFMVYDLQTEQDTLDFVQRVLVSGGMILILLIGMVSFFVTDWLVKPVRVAADVAERITAGHLEERLQQRGEDVIATLARSFNKMADSQQAQIAQITLVSQMQQAFVSNVSHELRTPLATAKITGDMIFANIDRLPDELQRPAQLMHEQLDRFKGLLDDLLEISRYDAGAVVTELEYQDIQQVVGLAIAAIEPLANDRGCRINVSLPSELVEVEIDQRRIERVLRNLLSNAVEHGEGKPIDVAVGANSKAVAITVTDHGIGMTHEQMDKVFERFWRADAARARTRVGGTGLGLSIAMEDAKVHDGWLQVWAEPNVGACFRLTLPRQRGVQFNRSPLPLPPASMLKTKGGENA